MINAELILFRRLPLAPLPTPWSRPGGGARQRSDELGPSAVAAQEITTAAARAQRAKGCRFDAGDHRCSALGRSDRCGKIGLQGRSSSDRRGDQPDAADDDVAAAPDHSVRSLRSQPVELAR
jgi:hypothetical protein